MVRRNVLQRADSTAHRVGPACEARWPQRRAGIAICAESSRARDFAGPAAVRGSAATVSGDSVLVAGSGAWPGDVGNLWAGQYRRAVRDGGVFCGVVAGVRGA